jgi:hypothetical protein
MQAPVLFLSQFLWQAAKDGSGITVEATLKSEFEIETDKRRAERKRPYQIETFRTDQRSRMSFRESRSEAGNQA